MKKYIFITTSIKIAGGNQCYTAAKAQYLESKGWDVFVFSSAGKSDKCLISSLDKYLEGNLTPLCNPPFKFPRFMVNRTLNKMKNLIGPTHKSDEIIIETHDAPYSQWGELLASRIGARHYHYLMNEAYRGYWHFYECKMDFYLFKFKRKEILGGLLFFNRLFKGYIDVKKEDIPGEVIINECPVQEVSNKEVNNIEKKDWNICYIGRGSKPYVENILIDVGRFAHKHPDKSIQLIIVGDVEMHQSIINNISKENGNLSIVDLGLVHPLPKSLYSKTDVVIAGSGSARHSAEEGAIVIVADTETKLSDGILGYETLNSVYQSDDSVVSDFCDALDRVFVERVQDHLVNRYPPKLGVEKCTQQNFELFSMSDRKLEYYDEEKMLEGAVDYLSIIKLYVQSYCPSLFAFIGKLTKKK